MSINAYIQTNVECLDKAYSNDMDAWAETQSFNKPTHSNYEAGQECGYLDSAFNIVVNTLAEIPAPCNTWRATIVWSAEEGATENGNTVRITIEEGRISNFEISRIVFDDCEPWPELVSAVECIPKLP